MEYSSNAELDYGSGQNGLNYPNPYNIQNKIMFIKIGTLLFSAIVLLFLAKYSLSSKDYINLGIKLVFAFGFIAYTIKLGLNLSKQMRVFFGRGQPSDLSPTKSTVGPTYAKNAQEIKEQIRQGAIDMPIPNGPFAGFIYSYFPNLLTAPIEVRFLMESLVSNVAKMSIILACFLIATLFSIGTKAFGWLGLFFMIVTISFFIQPIINKEKIFKKSQQANNVRDNHNISTVNLDINQFWKLIVVSIFFPIVFILLFENIGEILPEISSLVFGIQSFIVITLAIMADILNILALKEQLHRHNNITTSFSQDAITFNAMPDQLVEEIKRKLQKEWKMGVPNRVYMQSNPNIGSGQSGTFTSCLIEETQPVVPVSLEKKFTLNQVKNNKRLNKILNIELFGLFLHFLGVFGIVGFILLNKINFNKESLDYLGWGIVFISILSISAYLLKVAHQLWGRFDFESKLYIFELEGSFVRSKMNFGNQFKDSIQTQKEIISIENMTLRVYVTHLNTVVFGHGLNSNLNYRQIISMVGLKEESQHWVSCIKEFAEKQSLFVKTTSKEDFERVNSLSQMNALSNLANDRNAQMLTDSLNKNNILEKFLEENKNKNDE